MTALSENERAVSAGHYVRHNARSVAVPLNRHEIRRALAVAAAGEPA
jgi:hypothetical protein